MVMDGYTVGEVARLAHTSVRTLHHYDAIGLLSPSERTPAGYRCYSTGDLQRLQQILFYRELDFGLDAISAILADPGATAEDHLRRQHRLLREQVVRHQAMVEAIEKEMEARQMGISLTPEEQFEIFGSDKFGGEYAEEAEQRWGDTDAWKQSQRRTAAYTKQDWVEIKAEQEANERAFADALATGEPADGSRAMDLAEAHRRHISSRFYECDYAMHTGLAEMYLADERFQAHYEELAPGLAKYVHDAIVANSRRSG